MSSKRFQLSSACYLMPFRQSQVLLSKRFNTGWMDGHYSLIAGHLDGNETITQAMIREAKEEAAITISPHDLIPSHTLHRHSKDREYIDFFFATTKWKGQIKNNEPQKCGQLDWFPINNLPTKTLPYIKTAIQNYPNHPPFSEHGWPQTKTVH